MLNLIMHHLYKNINIKNKDLFYDIYKLEYALPLVIRVRYLIYSILLYICTIFFSVVFNAEIISIILLTLSIILFIANLYEINKPKNPCIVVSLMNFQIRGIKLEEKIRKFFLISNSDVLSKNDWNKIKKFDKGLYHDILSDESTGCCYYYSQEIGLIIKDVNLIWCSISDPFSKDKSYAHAIIEKNGYIYDPNLRISYNFEDYAKFYDLKIYKKWSYDEYSVKNFRMNTRKDFRSWCIQNGVSSYINF